MQVVFRISLHLFFASGLLSGTDPTNRCHYSFQIRVPCAETQVSKSVACVFLMLCSSVVCWQVNLMQIATDMFHELDVHRDFHRCVDMHV